MSQYFPNKNWPFYRLTISSAGKIESVQKFKMKLFK